MSWLSWMLKLRTSTSHHKQFLLIASQNGKLVESRLHYKTIKTTTYSSNRGIRFCVEFRFDVTACPSRRRFEEFSGWKTPRTWEYDAAMHVNPLIPQLSQEHLLQCGNGSSVCKKGYWRIRHYVQKPSKGRSPAHSKRRESRAQQGLWSLQTRTWSQSEAISWKVKSTEKHTGWICLYVLYSISTEF